jgi:hypothetical protein
MAKGHYIGLDRPKFNKKDEFISGVQTEEGNHKDNKRWPFGKKNPELSDLEAGDPMSNKAEAEE